MEKAKHVCAVLDMQGFCMGEIFYPRELSVVNNKVKFCFEIVSDIPQELKSSNIKHFNFQQHNIHGIPVKKVLNENTSRVFKSEDLKYLLYEIYRLVKSRKRNIFAIKNQQLAKILDEFELPYINLEKEIVGCEVCPPLHIFDKVYGFNNCFCLLHFTLARSKYFDQKNRCSLRKSTNIWNWLTQKLLSDTFAHDLNNKLLSLR